jgi:hypothetical protein
LIPVGVISGPVVGNGNSSTKTAASTSFGTSMALVTLPPDLNRVLSSGPLGNSGDGDANGPQTNSDRVLVQLPDASVLQGLLQLTILTQSAGSTESYTASSALLADLAGPADPFASVADSLGRMTRVWGEVLDRLFTTRSESDVLPAPHEDTDVPQESDAVEEADLIERLALLGRRPRTDVAPLLAGGDSGPSAADRAWANVLASLVVCPLALTLGRESSSRQHRPALVNREERN